MLVDASTDPWSIVFANEVWESVVGKQRNAPGTATPFWDVFQVGVLLEKSYQADVSQLIASGSGVSQQIMYPSGLCSANDTGKQTTLKPMPSCCSSQPSGTE